MTTIPPTTQPPDILPPDLDVDEIVRRVTEALGNSAQATITMERAAIKAEALKSLVGVAVLVVGLIAGGVATFLELQGKPTTHEMEDMVESKVVPLEGSVEKLERGAADVREEVERSRKVQEYLLRQSDWQGRVLVHVAEGKRGDLPAPPDNHSLLELLAQ